MVKTSPSLQRLQSQFDILLNPKRAYQSGQHYPGSKKYQTVHISKDDEDIIPSDLSTIQKLNLMNNKMWESEINGQHLKAEYWRRKIIKIKKLSTSERQKKLSKFYEKEFKSLQLEFDEKCRNVVEFYTVQIGNLNDSSIALIDTLKMQQNEDERVLNLALKNVHSSAKINKDILSLRKIEYALGQNQKFLEAQRIKEEIETLEKKKASQHFKERLGKNQSIRRQLGRQHKKEMKILLNKLALKKALLYNKLQRELKKLENWKVTHDDRLQRRYNKDCLKLDGKLKALAPKSHQNRIDFILNPEFEQVNYGKSHFLKRRQKTAPQSSKHALRAYQRSKSIYDKTKDLVFLNESRKALDNELNEKLKQNEKKKKKKLKIVSKGFFTQYIESNDQAHNVLVEIDNKKAEIRWKRQSKQMDDKAEEDKDGNGIMDMAIECKIRFEDIFDIECPSLSPFFNKSNGLKYAFDKTKCFSIYSTAIKLHLEAKSEKFMKKFAEKLTDCLLKYQNKKDIVWKMI